MFPPARHRAKAVTAGVLLAGLVILFPVTRAEAQDGDTCAFLDLSGARAATTLTVDADDRTYPRLTATTEYEIPLPRPGVPAPGLTALLGETGDKEYEDALWCFLARRPLNQLAPAGEYRQQPPVVRIKEATPAANGKEATPERIVLFDEVTGDLTSRTVPPLLGPWAVTLDSNHLQLQLINKDVEDYEKWRPRAFNSMTWTARIKLSGLRFHQLEPKPVSTDGEREALWEPLAGDKSGAIRASVNLDLPTRMAIASGSGALDAASHASLALVNVIFYVTLLILLCRYRDTSAARKKWRVCSGVSAVCWIPVLGLASGIFTAAAYWWYAKDTSSTGLGVEDTGFTGRDMPIAYWKWPGLICICAVGLIILFLLFLPYRERRPPARALKWASRVLLFFFGLILIVYGVIVLTSPEMFKLNNDFSPIFRLAELGKDGIGAKDNIIAGGGQLVLMMLFTCAVLFVTITVLHFTFWSIRLASTRGDQERYSLPRLWKLLVPSFVVSSVLMLQWISQQVEFWNRNNLFPAFDDDRRSQLIAEVTGRMVTYYVDLFAELTMNAVPWAAIAAIVFTLFWRGRGTTSLRPSAEEYLLLGLLFAAVVVTTGSSYVGFAVPIAFVVAFIIVGFILPRTRRFNLLETTILKQEAERELAERLGGRTDPRVQLIAEKRDVQWDQARRPVVDANSGNMERRADEGEPEIIESSLAESSFSPPSATSAADRRRWIRPADVAHAIGPGKNWWDNGLHAAKIVAVPSILAMAYFSYIEYIKIEDGVVSWFNSYLGLLRLLESMVWEVGFWVAAAFVLGCLWRTLPGRRGPTKGAVLWAGFVIPSALDFALGRGLLHQDRVDGVLTHSSLLLLELLLVGFALDWATHRDTPSAGIPKLSLATLYGLRGAGSTLSTLGVVVVPLLLTAIGIYIQLTSGSSAPDVPQVPDSRPVPSSGGPQNFRPFAGTR